MSERAAGFEARRGRGRIEPPDLGMPLGGDFRFGTENFFLIDRMDLDVSAGNGLVPIEGGEHESLAFPRSWILQQRINPDLAVLVRVKGDSMAPTLPDGALILVDGFDRDLRRPGVYAFNRGDASYVKRLEPADFGEDGSPRFIKVISDNPAYRPDILAAEEMNEIHPVGRVRCVITTL